MTDSSLPTPSTRRLPRASAVALCCLALLLAACKEPVLSKLSEVEANDALYTLLQGGVSAEKRSDGDAGYSVWAEEAQLATAIGLLKDNAQPQTKHQSLGELFGRSQLISTPTEERVRFVYGVEQALAKTLSEIDGVLTARVHIVLPQNDPLATTLKLSSASVFIKHRSDEDLSAAVPAIKDLVVRGIEGLTVDRVAVTLFPASPRLGPAATTALADAAAAQHSASFLGLAVPADSLAGLWMRFGLVALGMLAVSLLFARRGGGPSTPSAPATAARAGASTRPMATAHE